jgi:hypothetical protein
MGPAAQVALPTHVQPFSWKRPAWDVLGPVSTGWQSTVGADGSGTDRSPMGGRPITDESDEGPGDDGGCGIWSRCQRSVTAQK